MAKSLQKAQKLALGGENESQDTQLLAQVMHDVNGVGFRSSSPPAARTTQVIIPRSTRNKDADVDAVVHKKGETTRRVAGKTYGRCKTRRQTRTTQSRTAGPADSAHETSRAPSTPVLEDHGDADAVQDVLLPPAPTAPQPVADPTQLQGIEGEMQQSGEMSACALRKMESSQVDDASESGTTQSNEGRSYEQYFVQSPGVDERAVDENECAIGDPERFSHEPRRREDGTLEVNDTGAVKFSPDFLQAAGSDSVGRDESCLVDFDRDPAFQSDPNTAQSPGPRFPETPASHNPFANKSKASVLPPSQIFGKSSAVKQGTSPTSSRPSPDDIHTKDNTSLGLSSPTRGLGGPPSPRFSSDLPSSPGLEQTPPAEVDTEIVQQPSRLSRLAKRVGPEPKSVYEPMRKSQEKRLRSESNHGSLTSDEESPQREKRRVQARRQSANTGLESIRLPRQVSAQLPCAEQKEQESRTKTPAERYVEQCHGTPEDAVSQDRETVMDSQDQLDEVSNIPSSPVGTTTLSHRGMEENPPPATSFSKPTSAFDTNKHFPVSSRDTIPETSPNEKSSGDTANPAADVTASSSGDVGPSWRRSSRQNRVPESPQPPVCSAVDTTPAVIPDSLGSPSARDCLVRPVMENDGDEEEELPSTQEPRRENSAAVIGDVATLADPPGLENSIACVVTSSADVTVPVDPLGTICSSPPVVKPRSTEAQALELGGDKEKPKVTPTLPNGKPHGALAGPTSSLSSLSSVPSSTGTAKAVSAVASEPCAGSSPTTAKSRRRQNLGRSANSPRLATVVDNLRHSKRLARHRSTSTDELARSPQPADPRHGGLLFKGMAFAVSFQDKRPHESHDDYNDRVEVRKKVEKNIKDAGGRMLEGFDELFEPITIKSANSSKSARSPAPDLRLVNGAAAIGFTALIADGHSRKVKYMQALALNLPCIAAPWISACVAKKKLVDWVPYLLCAGESSLLGGAVRSRTLITKYEAAEAQLSKVVDQRARLLEGSNVLLVMAAKSAGKRLPYVFLAQALGASLSCVHTMPEAREKLKAAEKEGQPYDWVYVGDKADTELLFGESAIGTTKKRKRASAGPVGPAPKRIRTLNDQFIVQSLILEELLDETERAS